MIIVYIIISILILLTVLALVAPKKYDIERSIKIKKPLQDVYQHLKLTHEENSWSPWEKKHANKRDESFGTKGEVGFITKWEDNKDQETGDQEIKRVVENDTIEAPLRFYKPWKSQAEAFTKVEDLGHDVTEVTWSFSGVNKPPSNIYFLFFNMGKAIEKDFEDGLNDLKTTLENKK